MMVHLPAPTIRDGLVDHRVFLLDLGQGCVHVLVVIGDVMAVVGFHDELHGVVG